MTVAHELRDRFVAVVDGDPAVDRHEVFARLRAELPVFFCERLDSWIVSRFDDVKAVLSDDARFPPPTQGAGTPVYGRSFLQMSGREHNKKVGVVSRQIRSPRALRERLAGLVEAIADEKAAALPLGTPIDLRDYAMWIPLLAITELLGIEEATKFRSWYRAIAAGGISSINNPAAREAAFTARDEVAAFLAPIIEERRADPGDDLISDLVQAEYDGAALPAEEIAVTVVFLLTAGVETTERVLTSVLRHVALDRDEWDALRARRGDPVALTAFSAEALRVYPPVNGLIRTTGEQVELAGVEIGRDERLVVLLASANHDETHFADPERFDRDRFAKRASQQFTAVSDILPFGAGTHHCAGSRLAEVEMVQGLAKLLERVAWLEPVGELPPSEGFMLHSPPSLPVVLHG